MKTYPLALPAMILLAHMLFWHYVGPYARWYHATAELVLPVMLSGFLGSITCSAIALGLRSHPRPVSILMLMTSALLFIAALAVIALQGSPLQSGIFLSLTYVSEFLRRRHDSSAPKSNP